MKEMVMIMSIVDCCQGHHSKSMCPICCCRSSWYCNSFCFGLRLRCWSPRWDCCRCLQSQGSWSSLLFQSHLQQSGRNPFESRCVGHWRDCSPPRHPIAPWWHGRLSVWITLLANTLSMCRHQISSTSSQVVDPNSQVIEYYYVNF